MSYLEELNKYTESLNQQRESYEGLLNEAAAKYAEHAKEKFDRITEAMNMAGGTINALGMGVHGLARAQQSVAKLAGDKGINVVGGDSVSGGMWKIKSDVIERPTRPFDIQMGEIGEVENQPAVLSSLTDGTPHAKPKFSATGSSLEAGSIEDQIAQRGGADLMKTLKSEPVSQDNSVTASGRKLYGAGDIKTDADLKNVTTGGLRGASADEQIASMRKNLSASAEGQYEKNRPVATNRPIYENSELPVVPPDQQVQVPRNLTGTIDTGGTRAGGADPVRLAFGEGQIGEVETTGAKLKPTPGGVATGRQAVSDEELARRLAGKQPASQSAILGDVEGDSGVKGATAKSVSRNTGALELEDIPTFSIDYTGTRIEPASVGLADTGEATTKISTARLGGRQLGTTFTTPRGTAKIATPPKPQITQEGTLAVPKTEAEAEAGSADVGTEATKATKAEATGAEATGAEAEATGEGLVGELTNLAKGAIGKAGEGALAELGFEGGEGALASGLTGIGLEAAGGVGEVIGAGLLIGGILHDVLAKPDETDQVAQGAMAGKIGFDPSAMETGGESGGVAGIA